jgi:hypothetical protein
MPNVTNAECHKKAPYVECHYAECRYADCHYAEFLGVYKMLDMDILQNFGSWLVKKLFLYCF